MSSAKPKPVAEINLEEFERRLRASAAPQANVEDPLAELTRLVDTIGFERSPTERALELSRPRPAAKPDLRLAPPPEPQRLAPEPPKPAPEPPKPAAEIMKPPTARVEPPRTPTLLPPLEDTKPVLRPSFDAEHVDSLAFEPPAPALADAEAVDEPVASRPPRARGWGLKVGGLIAAAAVMAGAVVVFKIGGQTHSGPPPLILASTAPTKVAPPSEATVRTANETGALLTRDSAQPTPTPPKLVNPPEAPLDLAARPEPSPAASPTASAPAPATASASPSAAAEVEASPVAPSSSTPIVATAAPSAVPLSPVGADPSRVKTISVRPDGTIISQGYESATALKAAPSTPPTPAQPDSLATANADSEPASPPVALPTKLSPPKSAARVVAKTPTTAPADAGAGPVPVTPKPVAAKPKKPVAEAEPADDGADAAPAAASGGYAVQFGAPRDEGEAKALIGRFQSRYADALGGAALGVRKAKRDGSSIYRVRAGGLSKADANAMCAKVKAAGGDCFVAKN